MIDNSLFNISKVVWLNKGSWQPLYLRSRSVELREWTLGGLSYDVWEFMLASRWSILFTDKWVPESLLPLSLIRTALICETSSLVSSIVFPIVFWDSSDDPTMTFELCSDWSGSALNVPESSSSKLTIWAFFFFFFFSFFFISTKYSQCDTFVKDHINSKWWKYYTYTGVHAKIWVNP